MEFQHDGDINIQINKGLKTLINDPEWNNGRFNGDMPGTIPTDDAQNYPTELWMDVTLRNDKLNGYISAISIGKRYFYYYLPHWIEMKRSQL